MLDNIKSPSIVILPDGRMDAKNSSIYLGLSSKTLAMMRCNGTGPKYVKIGRIFYYQRDLDAWLQARIASGTGKAALG